MLESFHWVLLRVFDLLSGFSRLAGVAFIDGVALRNAGSAEFLVWLSLWVDILS